jgi:hypothetical protein
MKYVFKAFYVALVCTMLGAKVLGLSVNEPRASFIQESKCSKLQLFIKHSK